MPDQLIHNQVLNGSATFDIVVVLDNLRTPENVGMAYRISEAMGAKTICLCGETPNLLNRKVTKTSRSTEKNIQTKMFDTSENALMKLKSEGYKTVALEITDDSQPLVQLDVKAKAKIAIIVGAERAGVSKAALEKCDSIYHIPMYGDNTSVNVIQALSIGLYEVTKQLSV